MPSRAFLEVHSTIQQHLFPQGSGAHPVLLDWPDCLGEVKPDAAPIKILRNELGAFRKLSAELHDFGGERHWVIEAAVQAQSAWKGRFRHDTDQPEAPWHLAYLAALVGAWRDNQRPNDRTHAVWPAISRGLNPSHMSEMQPSSKKVDLTRWERLFEGLEEWSSQRTDGRFLALQAGPQAFVRFIRAQRVASSADISRIAQRLFQDDSPLVDIGSVRRVIGDLGDFDRPYLKDLLQSGNDLQEELLDYVLRLVREEMTELREAALELAPEQGENADGPISLGAFAWHDGERWCHRYLPSSPARDSFPAWLDHNPGIRRNFEVVGRHATVDDRPITLQDLVDCRRDCRGHLRWSTPSLKKPIVLSPDGDGFVEEPRGSELLGLEEYLVWWGAQDFKILTGSVIAAELAWGFALSRNNLFVPQSGVQLRRGVYHSLALPRLVDADTPAHDSRGHATVQGGRLWAVDLRSEHRVVVQVCQGDKRQSFEVRNPRPQWLEPDAHEEPARAFVAGPLPLVGDWTEALEFEPSLQHFGLLQVLGTVGPRSVRWVKRAQKLHFEDGVDDDRLFWSLRRLGHVVPQTLARGDRLEVRSPELVWMPMASGPEGHPVFWLRGGFDWWRLGGWRMDGAWWNIQEPVGDAPPTLMISGDPETLVGFCREARAQMVDPARQLESLEIIASGAAADLERPHGPNEFAADPGVWNLFLPFWPTKSKQVAHDGNEGSDWGAFDAFALGHETGPFLATREHDSMNCLFQSGVATVRRVRGDIPPPEMYGFRREAINLFWRNRLAHFTGCDPKPAVVFKAKHGWLYAPGQPDWPFELCAALSAFSGAMPRRIDRVGMPPQLHRMREALQSPEPPDWRGRKIAPCCDWSWRYDLVPPQCAELACQKLGWTVEEIT